MIIRAFAPVSLLFGILLFVTGCSSSMVSGSWKDPNYNKTLDSVYVIGISKKETTRRYFEDNFSQAFAQYGVNGLVSYESLNLSQKTDEETINKDVESRGAKTILLAHAIGKRKELGVNPGPNYTSTSYPRRVSGRRISSQPYYRSFGTYFQRSWELNARNSAVAYTDQYEVVTIEATLYDVSTGNLIWSAEIDSVVANKKEVLINDFVENVIKDLAEKGLI